MSREAATVQVKKRSCLSVGIAIDWWWAGQSVVCLTSLVNQYRRIPKSIHYGRTTFTLYSGLENHLVQGGGGNYPASETVSQCVRLGYLTRSRRYMDDPSSCTSASDVPPGFRGRSARFSQTIRPN